MTLKSVADYRESLRDGREVWWGGERIADVTTHPAFVTPIAVAGRDYDYSDPDRTTYLTEKGERANSVFEVPTDEAGLRRRIGSMGHQVDTVVGGVTLCVMALMSVRDAVAAVAPDYADNIERFYHHVRDNDLRAAEVITDAKGDRQRRAHEQDDPDLYLRIVERRDDGIVVSGAKLHITAAALVHELVIMPTKGMREEEADYAVSFAIPVATPGVTIINRGITMEPLNEFDYPASSHHVMPEGFVVFDNVFVPWDRVFLAGEVKLAAVLAQSLGLWERAGSLVGAVQKAELFVGLGQLVTEMQGKERDPTAAATIAELICFTQMLRMALYHACAEYETRPSGLVHPNILSVNTGKYYYASGYHNAVKLLHDLGGGLVMTMPLEAELRNPHTGPYLRKYLHTRPDVDIEERMRIYNLIRDLTADAYGGWNQVVALQAGGGLSVQRLMMNRTFDMNAARQRAKRAAGIMSAEAVEA